MNKFISAIDQICEEKNIPRDVVLETVEAALAAAYKKDYGDRDQEVRVKIDEETGEIKAFVSKAVVQDVENDFLEMTLEEAKKVKSDAKLEDVIEIEDTPTDFGRIAAQTAKQVIIQRIREAERDIVFAEYKDREGELVNAQVQRIEGNTVIVDLGQASGVLFSNEQVQGERYFIGQRIKVYIVKVEQSNRGPQVVVSRSHPGVIKKLFETEVPEIESGIVVLKSIAREAGYRTKIAVASTDENVDPVGSCVGQRGIRVQAVMAELGEEKIDVIPFSEDDKEFITNALSPAKVSRIELIEGEEKKAKVFVKEDQLSLAIGKSGQNVRLAAKLTGWSIDINTDAAATEDGSDDQAEGQPDISEAPKAEEKETQAEAPETTEAQTEAPTEEPATETEEVVDQAEPTPAVEPNAESSNEEISSEDLIETIVDEAPAAQTETPEQVVEEVVKELEAQVPAEAPEQTEVQVPQTGSDEVVVETAPVEAEASNEVQEGTAQESEQELANEIEADNNEDSKV